MGQGKRGGMGWGWGGGQAGMVRVRSTACLFFNETYRSQFVCFIFLLRASAPNAVCGFSFPAKCVLHSDWLQLSPAAVLI